MDDITGPLSQEDRKREFFRELRENLANDDPKHQDRLVDEFRELILRACLTP